MRPTACVICQTPLPIFPADPAPVCRGLTCRWTYQSLPRQHLCPVCGRILSAQDRARGACLAAGCLQSLVAEQRRARWESLRQQALALREAGGRAMGAERIKSFRLTLIPSQRDKTRRLPQRRRRAFRERLRQLIDEEARGGTAPRAEPVREVPPPSPRERAVQTALGAACASCRGSCCRTGGNHAYMTPDTIRRYRQMNPGLTPDEIMDAYLGRLGHNTYEGSCVFHQPDGCALPRDMRSDTCNRYLCDGLTDFVSTLPDEGPVRVFLASIDRDTVRGGTFVEDGTVRGVRPPRLKPGS